MRTCPAAGDPAAAHHAQAASAGPPRPLTTPLRTFLRPSTHLRSKSSRKPDHGGHLATILAQIEQPDTAAFTTGATHPTTRRCADSRTSPAHRAAGQSPRSLPGHRCRAGGIGEGDALPGWLTARRGRPQQRSEDLQRGPRSSGGSLGVADSRPVEGAVGVSAGRVLADGTLGFGWTVTPLVIPVGENAVVVGQRQTGWKPGRVVGWGGAWVKSSRGGGERTYCKNETEEHDKSAPNLRGIALDEGDGRRVTAAESFGRRLTNQAQIRRDPRSTRTKVKQRLP